MPDENAVRRSGAVCKITAVANARQAIGEIVRLLGEVSGTPDRALPYRHRYNLQCAGVELAFAAAYLDNVLRDAKRLGVA